MHQPGSNHPFESTGPPELGPVRFDLVAEGFGWYGVRVATGEELLPALREGLTRNCPTLIHVPIVRSSPAD